MADTNRIIDQRGTTHTAEGGQYTGLRVSTFTDGTVILTASTAGAQSSVHIDTKAAMDFALAIIASVQTKAPEEEAQLTTA